MKMSCGENYDKLYFSLNKLESLLKMLKSGCENGIYKIKEHCIQHAEQINKLNHELIEIIREYEC